MTKHLTIKNIIIVALVIVVIALLVRGCDDKNDRTLSDQQKKDHAAFLKKQREDSMKVEVASARAAIAEERQQALADEANNALTRLDKASDEAKTYAKLYQAERRKSKMDTLFVFETGDSLAAIAIAQDAEIDTLKQKLDSANHYTKKVLEEKDNVIAAQKNTINDGMKYGELMNSKFLKVDGDLTKTNKKLRRSQFWNKALPIGAAVAGFFLGTQIK